MSFLHPQRYVARIDQIDVDELVAQGVRLVLFDRDNTVVPRSTRVADPAAVAWLGRVRAAGIGTCMISNNFHATPVEASAAELGSGVVHHAMKPAPFAVWVALAREGVPAEQTVLVGDQMLTDVAAGNLAGVRTILVRPQSRRDMWYTYAFRVAEHFLLRGHAFEGEDAGLCHE